MLILNLHATAFLHVEKVIEDGVFFWPPQLNSFPANYQWPEPLSVNCLPVSYHVLCGACRETCTASVGPPAFKSPTRRWTLRILFISSRKSILQVRLPFTFICRPGLHGFGTVKSNGEFAFGVLNLNVLWFGRTLTQYIGVLKLQIQTYKI